MSATNRTQVAVIANANELPENGQKAKNNQ
jgi:hypothetical protein